MTSSFRPRFIATAPAAPASIPTSTLRQRFPGLTLVSAGQLPLAALAALFEAAFSGYAVPIRQNAALLAARVRSEQIDLEHSRVALRDGAPCALCLLARRGDTMRIAAMGVVPAARGAGLGRLLLDEAIAVAREQRAARLLLEVLGSNAVARRLYERAGLRPRRRLLGWQRAPFTPRAEAALRRTHCIELARALGADHALDWPWQLAPASVASGYAWMSTYAIADKAYAWIDDRARDRLALGHLFVAPHARGAGYARRLLVSLQAHFPGRAWTIPPLVPEEFGGAVLEALGFTRSALDQVEMELALG
ncbi:acetyltransferase, GNAT family [Mizugakiibacter sediminis]|uniref:Acetyltransferase, GNAT family n=1 Tax=Mizugakiibacter sediminis TaxID=1475481 RepID=A0A0K8QMX4_9GAMM|nr:acetyltransferase, GNAT family [Mizugakiibacter sediminis]